MHSFAAPGDVSVCSLGFHLSCEFTESSKIDVDPGWLKVRFTPQGKPDLSGLAKLIALFKAKHPELDYSSCLLGLASASQSYKTGDEKLPACVKLHKSFDENVGLFKAGMKSMIADYMEAQDKANALPHYEPGGKRAPDLEVFDGRDANLYQFTDRVENRLDKATCYFPDFTEIVSKEFLEILAEGASKIHPGCRENVARAYRNVLAKLQLDEKSCKKNQKACEARYKQVRDVSAWLEAMGIPVVSGADGKSAASSDPLKAVAATCKMSNIELMDLFLNPANTMTAIAECLPLKKGFSRKITGDTGTGMESSYKLTRLSENEHKISFNLNFLAPAKGPKGSRPTALPAKDRDVLVKRINSCFAKTNPYFRQPDGKNVVLELEDPPPADTSYRHDIIVHDRKDRENSGEWQKSTPCEVILHELMHVAGLVDEYKEKLSGTVVDANGSERSVENLYLVEGSRKYLDYDCRVLGPYNSLMSNQSKLFDEFFPDVLLECECPSKDVACMAKLEETDGKYRKYLSEKKVLGSSFADEIPNCPDGKPARKSPIKRMKGEQWRKMPKFFDTHDGRKVMIFNQPPYSLLRPAQFRAITEPGCPKSNKLFYQCASQSKKTSVKNHGTGRCGAVPEKCTNPEEWMK